MNPPELVATKMFEGDWKVQNVKVIEIKIKMLFLLKKYVGEQLRVIGNPLMILFFLIEKTRIQ